MTATCQAASCAVAKGLQRFGNPTPFVVATELVNRNAFVALSKGIEQVIKLDMASLDGVSDVQVTRDGQTFRVRIVLNRFEYEVRKSIFAKELQLFDTFPDVYFDVTVTPAE